MEYYYSMMVPCDSVWGEDISPHANGSHTAV